MTLQTRPSRITSCPHVSHSLDLISSTITDSPFAHITRPLVPPRHQLEKYRSARRRSVRALIEPLGRVDGYIQHIMTLVCREEK